MSEVFVDTAAWIALVNADDELHKQARQVMSSLRQQHARLVTTDFVLLEVADALSAPSFRLHIVSYVEELRRLPILQIIPVSQQLLADGMNFL